MKAQFRYAFFSVFAARYKVFAVIFIMNAAFILLGSLGALPVPALITAVSLSGVAIAVMMVMNIIGDVAIIRGMFVAPGAYLYALTPVPRWKTLLAGVLTITAIDIVSMAVSIAGVTWVSFILVDSSSMSEIGSLVRSVAWFRVSDALFGIWMLVLFFLMYMTVIMVIIFCVTVKKSVLYQKRGGGVLTALLAIGIVHVINVSPLLLAPFGYVRRWGFQFTVYLGRLGVALYVPLMFAIFAALFVMTSRLMERKLNI